MEEVSTTMSMIDKTVALAIIYSLVGIGALLIMTLTARKYARLGRILVFAEILSFVIFYIVYSLTSSNRKSKTPVY